MWERARCRSKKICSSKVRRTRIFRREKLLYETKKIERQKKPNRIGCASAVTVCERPNTYETTLEWFLFSCVSLCMYLVCLCAYFDNNTRVQNKNDNLFTQFRYECVYGVYTHSLTRLLALFACTPVQYRSQWMCVLVLVLVRVCIYVYDWIERRLESDEIIE